MVGWHHRLSGHEFEQTPGDSGRQGSLVCCGPWGQKESDTTEQLNNKAPKRGANQEHSSHSEEEFHLLLKGKAGMPVAVSQSPKGVLSRDICWAAC